MNCQARKHGMRLKERLGESLREKLEDLQPFHWELEFPDVFYQSDGQPLPEAQRGFDAILGNPPYISPHTSTEERWRAAVQSPFGYLEDLYVHFSDLGFQLLRPGGMFGFIVSDTFFTLTGKLRLRELLQANRLAVLGQCDPFEATVDAAIFAAQKGKMANDERLLFVQARYGSNESQPERELPKLPESSEVVFNDETAELSVNHGTQGCLRYHEVPIGLFREAARKTFFEPRPTVLQLYEKYNSPLKDLADEWWQRIDDSRSFRENLESIRAYQASLKPGHITLIGLIAEGAQGMRTGNNAKFVGYLEGTPQAKDIEIARQRWTREWVANPKVGPIFVELLKQAGGDPRFPLKNSAAWETSVADLRTQIPTRELGFNRTDLYRIVPIEQVAAEDDFNFAWKERKKELVVHWKKESQLKEFWEGSALFAERENKTKYEALDGLSDRQFCELCQELVAWWERENEKRRRARP